MSNIKEIKTKLPVNADLVEFLERALLQAKKGELRSVFVIKSWTDGDVTNGWTIDDQMEGLKIAGALSLAQTEYNISISLSDRESPLLQEFPTREETGYT